MDVLEELKSRGVKMGVLSNSAFGGAVLEEELARLGMSHFFSFVISSSDYGLRKPHRRIIELAVKNMVLTPREIWFVGDKPDYDLKGALNGGLFPA